LPSPPCRSSSRAGLGDALQFYLTRNPGAAFSLLEGQTWIFTIVMTVAAVVIVS
jgi:signal peptidase II